MPVHIIISKYYWSVSYTKLKNVGGNTAKIAMWVKKGKEGSSKLGINVNVLHNTVIQFI